ncbi:hypothetical protein DH2020_014887 [Rehmannia glutinosa]|uniref:Expp1 protein n=1 Tax=Rehmannia glutinosa TaxID=99300 RepID=A0ABR0WXR5_REHGL
MVTASQAAESPQVKRQLKIIELKRIAENLSFETMAIPRLSIAFFIALFSTIYLGVSGSDSNNVFSPCSDASVQRSDGFTFGIAFAARTAFFSNNTQLSPCDRRLSLSSGNSQVAVFRPKVDEISLLTINTSNFFPLSKVGGIFVDKVVTSWILDDGLCGDVNVGNDILVPEWSLLVKQPKSGSGNLFSDGIHWLCYKGLKYDVRREDSVGGYMVAFAGRRYAARSIPAFVANSTYIVTSFTLVHEFKKGRLENLFWKRDGCSSCSGRTNFVCLNNQDCAIRTSSCRNRGGSVDCSLGIQLAFSGTDKHESVFNSWYEVQNLRQYSLYGLYSNLRDSLTSQYNRIF